MNVREVVRDLDWEAIEDAVETVATGRAKRIDGEGWKVYMVVAVVRIDIAINNQG
jgi:hypothetical protein